MDTGIMDTINRMFAMKLAAYCDSVDEDMRRAMLLPNTLKPWHDAPIADALMRGDDGAKWLIVTLSQGSPDIEVNGLPADADWENLFSAIRAEILARRDTDSSSLRAAENPVEGMV